MKYDHSDFVRHPSKYELFKTATVRNTMIREDGETLEGTIVGIRFAGLSTSKHTMATSLKTLENSLYWQNVVLKQSSDPKQKERCKAAIERLQAQIDQIKAANAK